MKIALVHTRYSYTGGVEKYIHSLVERLLAAGHEVHYLAARWEPREHPRLVFHRIRLVRWPPSLRVLAFNRSVNQTLARESFDLVHGFTKTDRQDIYTDGSGCLADFIAATMAHRPRWYRHLYLATPHQRAILRMERRRFRRGAIRAIIPMARFVREQILARYPVEPGRIEVLYNGVELDRFSPAHRPTIGAEFRRRHGIESGRRVLLFVGNDWFRKGLDVVLQAFPSILRARQEPPPLLVVAGHDNHGERYRRMAHDAGVAHHVLWLGAQREISEPFAAADAFLFPSRYDVFGNVGLEALASGVPAALSSRAGVSEVLDGSAAGIVLEDPTDARALARAAWELLDEARLDERRRAARAIAERYSWDSHFARLLEIYENVLSEKKGARGAPMEARPT